MRKKIIMNKTFIQQSKNVYKPICILIVLILFGGRMVSAWSLPQECEGTKNYWQEQIIARERAIERYNKRIKEASSNFSETLLGVNGLVHSDPWIEATNLLAQDDYRNLPPRLQAGVYEAFAHGQIQHTVNPWDQPKPGSISMQNAQMLKAKVSDLRSQIKDIQGYMDRCFPEEDILVRGARIHHNGTKNIHYGGTANTSFEAWNCLGLEGEWQLLTETTIDGSDIIGPGAIAGEATFIMPPRPESGAWESFPFTVTIEGKLPFNYLHETGAIEYKFLHKNVVAEITQDPLVPWHYEIIFHHSESEGTLTLSLDSKGSSSGEMHSLYNNILSSSYTVYFDPHPACN